MNAVPVLMYHHVSPQPGLVTVSPEIFEAHVACIARSGYRTLAADEFLDFIVGRRVLAGRHVLITFDDGYLDNYVYAYPILARYGLRATLFAITGLIGDGAPRAHLGSGQTLPATPNHRACKAAVARGESDRVMLRWSEIEAMEARGIIETHSHSHRHQRWDQLYADSSARIAAVEADLAESHATLKERLSKSSRHLGWPWGYFESSYQDAAARIGFVAQYSTAKGVNVPGSDPRRIARVVTKAKSARWLGTRLALYRRPWLGRWYARRHDRRGSEAV